jgi:serine/threonine protein kinase
MIAPGTVIGSRYRVVQVLGGGGMKLVYLAEDLRLAARRCALAEMVDGFTSPDAQQNAIAAFQREADMLAQLSNEHIPRIIDRFSEANHHYLVMEYIDGTTLEDQLKSGGGKLAPDYVVEVALQVLETLEYLHGLMPPVIYRDLKPSNVMITAEGQAKLIDFGIARHFAPLSNATMIGTQGYAPPEQYRGKVEARSDLYALGATMHHALSGRDPAAEPPFSFPPLRKAAPEIDPALATAVDQALAYDVASRTRDASEFKRRLVEVRQAWQNALQDKSQKLATPPNSILKPPAPQMQLPLGNAETKTTGSSVEFGARAPSPEQAAPDAATVVIANPEIKCPACARIIPADSRYCSYCAVEIRAPAATGANPNDPTVLLSPAPASHRESERRAGRPRPRRVRHPIGWLILVVLAGFFAMKALLRSVGTDEAPAGYDSGASEPPAAPTSALSPIQRFRMIALRQALNDSNYRTVRFRLDGDTLVLSGTIPSEDDRATVQMMCANIGGVDIIRDNLRVADASAGG